MNDSEKIAIIGKGAKFPSGDFGERFSSPVSGDEISLPITHKRKRYMSVTTPRAIRVSEYAFYDAGIDPLDKTQNIGLYAGQYGYLHPQLSEFVPTFIDTRPQTVEGAFRDAWDSAKVSPFLVTQLLSNNLTGLLSLHWGIAGDCAALVRDSLSAASTLQEAVFSLKQGACTTALAICGGAQDDLPAQNFLRNDGEKMPVTEPEHGAAALVLKCLSQAGKDKNKVLGVIEHIFNAYDLDSLAEKISAQLALYPDLEQVVCEFAGAGDGERFFSRLPLEDVRQSDLSVIEGARGCPGLISVLYAALAESQEQTGAVLAISGSETGHYSAVIIKRNL